MSPETATNHPWRQLFSMKSFPRRLTLIAVDEAHCIAEWFVILVLLKFFEVYVHILGGKISVKVLQV